MKNTSKFLFLILFLLGTIKTFATTWNEPWADKVIKDADYFVLAKILSFNEKSVKIEIVKQLGGKKLPKEVTITGFYGLGTKGSVSAGRFFEFIFNKNIKKSYFFIKKDAKGNYCIATPTAGWDYVVGENVCAAYRHSYHQALVPVDIYELTMSAIFNHYRQLPYDKKQITDLIDKQLSKKPAGFDKTEVNTFYLQHVALETIFHLRLEGYYSQILPFFNDTSNFHNRVSAARALVTCNNDETKKLLLNKIETNDNDNFITVICIWTLKEFNPKTLKSELQKLIENASTKETGFGGNLMDPRVGTRFPNVKEALIDLISTL